MEVCDLRERDREGVECIAEEKVEVGNRGIK
jgi:hypothetical protein